MLQANPNFAGQTTDSSYANGGGQAAAGVASPIPSTPPVISSKDMAGSFAQNSAKLASMTPSTVSSPTGAYKYDASGNIVDSSGSLVAGKDTAGGYGSTTQNGKALTGLDDKGNLVFGGGPTTTAGAGNTAVEKGAAAGAGNGSQPLLSTGNPIYDSLQAWEQQQQTKNEADAATKKQQVQDMLKTNLAANDATYAAQITGIQNTYAQLITTQNRINDLNISRVKAYGLSSGNAMTTPIEFTYAVSNEEQTAADAIQKLDGTRDSLIAQAQAAMASGDAKLLSDSFDQMDKVEADMRAQTSALQTQIDSRFATLQGIQKDQEAKLKETQQNLLATALQNYGESFSNETDPKKKDALIKEIVNASGGVLDYGTVFGSLTTNAAALAEKKTQAAKDAASLATSAADVKLKGAQTAEAYASAAKTSAAKTSAANTQSDVFNAIDNRLQPGVKNKSGMPYLDANGFMTKGGFDELLQGAHQNNVTRATFLKEYAGHLDPAGYTNYGLTKAEQDMLTNTNKVTPIVIPPSPTQ